MKEILVSTLMTREVSCLAPDAAVRLAVAEMVNNRFSCIIIKQDNIAVGIITERDLGKLLNRDEENQDLDIPASQIMSAPVITLNQNESLFDALVVSRAEHVRHLPVVNDDNELVGLVTQSDLASAHLDVLEKQSEFIEQSIASKTVDLEKIITELLTLSMEDHLLKVGNRRSMEVDLDHTHASALRYKQRYSVLFVDVDLFKLYNDHYGHQMGDEALQRIANTLKSNTRSSDRLYRYGGEELLLILPNASAEESRDAAQKLVDVVANELIPHIKSPHNYLTVSIGGSCMQADEKNEPVTWKDIVKQADKALYQAKEDGRNRVVISP